MEKQTHNLDFHQVICNARKSMGITQTQLSQKTGIAQCDISRIESGKANPSIKTIKRLAKGMDMGIEITLLPA